MAQPRAQGPLSMEVPQSWAPVDHRVPTNAEIHYPTHPSQLSGLNSALNDHQAGNMTMPKTSHMWTLSHGSERSHGPVPM